MTRPYFSVLLPTHNRADVLELAIRSVLAQTFEDFELLVVGDGCTDNSADVVSGFGDPRIRWFDLPKAPGFGYRNRNIALDQSDSELVAFLGHDNLFLPDHLEQLARPFRNSRTQFAYSRPLWVDDSGLVVPFFVNIGMGPSYRRFMQERNVLPASCIVHRRACLGKSGGWPEDVERSGDWQLWKRILADHMPGALGLVRVPTCLHFRANWRDPGAWAPPPFGYLRAVAESGGYWPGDLRLELQKGTDTPQHQVWRRLSENPDQFAGSLRRGTVQAQELLAWNAGLDPSFAR